MTTEDLEQNFPNGKRKKSPPPPSLPILKPSKRKKIIRKKRIPSPQEIFETWLNQWKNVNTKYTVVDLSIHAANEQTSKNFLMLSQASLQYVSEKEKIMIHYKMIPAIIKDMRDIYIQLKEQNEKLEPSNKKKEN